MALPGGNSGMIRILHALAEMQEATETGHSSEFSLQFITSEGKISRIKRGVRGARKPGTGGDGSKPAMNMKEHNLIHVTDLDLGQVKAITIALITHFNNQIVWH
jgi:hypothetical protein